MFKKISLYSKVATILLGLLALHPLLGVNAQPFALEPASEWKLKRDKKNIQVYTQKIKGVKHKAVKAETVTDAVTIDALIAVILHAESCPDWADLCKESYVHSKNSETDYYVYTLNDLPSPVKDRDALTRVTWHKDPATDAVVMQSQVAEGILEEQKGAVRILNANIQWTFTPNDAGVKIESWALIDPVGIPSWISNQLLVGAPYKTLLALIEQARKPLYNKPSNFYSNL